MPASCLESSHSPSSELNMLDNEPKLENVVSSLNLDVLKARFQSSDIFPKVKLDLRRDQDRKQAKRVSMGCNVAQKLVTSLLDVFPGDPNHSELVLQVNITVVSNGCASRPVRKLSGILKRGSEQGRGMAKLTVAYCLYSRQTGAVAVSRQLSATQERSAEDTRRCNDVLLDLIDGVFNTLRREVFFICCSRIPSWQHMSKEMLGVHCVITKSKVFKPGRNSSIESTTERSCSSIESGPSLK